MMNKPKKAAKRKQEDTNEIKQTSIQEEPGEDSPLGRCEKQIQLGRRAYYIIGKQLKSIKNKELYKEKGFKSFDEYCAKRWHYGKKYPYVLINASDVWSSLLASFGQDEMPDSAKALELLYGLTPENRVAAYKKALTIAQNERVAIKHVNKAVSTLFPSLKKARSRGGSGIKVEKELKLIKSIVERFEGADNETRDRFISELERIVKSMREDARGSSALSHRPVDAVA